MPNNGIPAYLKVDSCIVKSTQFGEPNSSIYGLSVTIEADNRGIVQLPFKIPALVSGIKSTIFTPYVKKNDLSSVIVKYPMYKPFSIDLNYVPQTTFDTNFVFEYADNVNALLMDDFEIAINFSGGTTSNFSRNGQSSFKMKSQLNTKDSIASAFYYKKIRFDAYKETYLEFDYYMESGIFSPSLVYEDSLAHEIKLFSGNGLLPRSRWVHVYWHLSPLIGEALINHGVYNLNLAFYLTPQIGKESAEIYIDNLKILEK